jgi:hypothetical protein
MCKKNNRAVHPTWDIHLAPFSKDKGPYSMPRGGQRQPSSGSEPAKALVRDLPLPRPLSFRGQLGSYQSYDLSGELAEDLTAGLHGTTSDRLVAGGVDAGGEGAVLLPISAI